MSWLYKLERKYGRYAIENLAKYLVIVNGAFFVVMFVLQYTAPQAFGLFYQAMTLTPALVAKGQIWRLVTFAFLPGSTDPLWTALGLYFLYLMGSTLERSWGAFKFNVYYLIGILGTILGAVVVSLFVPMYSASTALYVNMSLFLAFATLFPDYQIMLFFVLPVKAKWMAWVEVAFVLWAVVSSFLQGSWGGAVAPVVSLLNYLLFFGRDLVGFLHRKRRVVNNRRQFFDTVNRATAEREARHKHEDNIRRF